MRALLALDRRYYSTTDDSFLREMVSRIAIAGKQILLRPALLKDAVKAFDLRALYVPDRRRILHDCLTLAVFKSSHKQVVRAAGFATL